MQNRKVECCNDYLKIVWKPLRVSHVNKNGLCQLVAPITRHHRSMNSCGLEKYMYR